MKLLYCIFAVCVVVNADPVPPTREQLENLAKSILESAKHAPETIDKVVATTALTVQDKLMKNKFLQKVQTILEDKLNQSVEIRHEIPEDLLNCSVNIVNGFQKLAADVNDDLLQKLTNERYGKQGDYLGTLKKELADIKDVLENHVDGEIESCLIGKNGCKLTDEYLSKSEEYFTFENLMKSPLVSMVKSSDEYFNSEEVGNKIVVDFTHPAYECLDKLAH